MQVGFKHAAVHCPKNVLHAARSIQSLCLLLLFFIPSIAPAAIYYVDSVSGNDLNNGNSISTPWRTISRVNSRSFNPGDTILFKRGNIWREQLAIPSSGAAGSPITFGAYGTGAKPVISGADTIAGTSWRLYRWNIYVSNVGAIVPPTQLYVDGMYYDPAHYPNIGYLLATADSSDTTSIIDSNLDLKDRQILGATVKVRSVPWSISTATAIAYDSAMHRITLSGPVYNAALAMRAGYGFCLQDMLWMLDSPGEWHYDRAAGMLYLWTSGGDNPRSHTVEISNRAYGVYNDAKNYIIVRDLVVTKANQSDVYVLNAKNVELDNLDVSGGQSGISFDGKTSSSSVRYCAVQNSLSNGIVTSWMGATDMDIANNTVANAGYVGAIPGMSQAGIGATGTGINIVSNTVSNSGYIGIQSQGDLITIKNNLVDKSCLVLDDCGGIYTFGRNTGTVKKNISGNTVSNSIGNLDGTPNTSTQARGIYLDDGAYNTIVENNTVSNADYGIHIHLGHDNTVRGNSILGARRNGLWIQEDYGTPGSTHDNIVMANVFETTSEGAAVCYSSSKETATNFGICDYNRYCHPNSDYAVRKQNVSYRLAEWQQVSGQDLHSTDTKSSCETQSPVTVITQP